jgi:hypothetical protein
MLAQIVYVSARKPLCTEEEIQKILASCQKNNSKINITGVLLYSNSQFIQYLEGEYNQIMELYDKIKLDSRHKNTVLISSGPIKARSFPSWHMGAKEFDSERLSFQTQITSEDKAVFTSILAGQHAAADKSTALIKKFFK